MAFRTNGLSKAFSKAQTESINVKASSINASTVLAASSVSANQLIQIMSSLKSSIEVWDAASSLPGMLQYAKDQYNDQTYDVVAEFTTMRAAAAAARDWIITNFPKSVGGFIEKDTLEVDGAITVRAFTPAQTAGLRTALTNLAATIL